MPRGAPAPVRAVRVPDALWERVKAAAAVEGVTTSEWVVETLARRARRAVPRE